MGWHGLGWSLLRRVHLAARPGAVKDLRVRRGALAGCATARVARAELVASATGILVVAGARDRACGVSALLTACAGLDKHAGAEELACATSPV